MLTITHAFVSSKTDGSDATQVRPSDWNNSHIISGNVDETMFSFTDITTANVSTSKHGLTPKLPGVSTEFLNGAGAWTTPSSGGSFDFTANNLFTGQNIFQGDNDAEYGFTFPLAVNGAVQGAYGFIGFEVISFASESGLQINCQTSGGRTYTLLSTSNSSSLGGGLFVIADATASQPRFVINNSGFVGLGGNISPAFTLDVTGDINFTGNFTQNGSLFISPGSVNTTSSGPSPVVDCSLGTIQVLDLGQNMSPTFINIIAGQRLSLYVLQGGNFAITWPENVGGNPEINYENGSTTIIDFISADGTNLEPVQYGGKALPGDPNSLSVVAHGGDLWYDADGLWIGQENGSWRQILYS